MIIYKYTLFGTDRQSVSMPKGATILDVQYQGSSLQLWALVNPDAEHELRVIDIFGTGHPIDNAPRSYITTVQAYSGSLVLHVFELLRNS
jgi:anti-sigma-K factor RskA